MKIAITLNKTELESLATLTESKEFSKLLVNLGFKKMKKVGVSATEKLTLMFGKTVTRNWYGIEIKFSKTACTITAEQDYIGAITTLVNDLSNKKNLTKLEEDIAINIAHSKGKTKSLKSVTNALDNLVDEVRFHNLMGH